MSSLRARIAKLEQFNEELIPYIQFEQKYHYLPTFTPNIVPRHYTVAERLDHLEERVNDLWLLFDYLNVEPTTESTHTLRKTQSKKVKALKENK